jgi:hypothetical protein
MQDQLYLLISLRTLLSSLNINLKQSTQLRATLNSCFWFFCRLLLLLWFIEEAAYIFQLFLNLIDRLEHVETPVYDREESGFFVADDVE